VTSYRRSSRCAGAGCNAGGRVQSRNPWSNGVTMPAISHCRIAHSWPFSQIQIGYGGIQ
jgi:hypothetical protein